MNGTTTEDPIEGVHEMFPKTAHEAAGAYEAALDATVDATVPGDETPNGAAVIDVEPRGPVPNGPAPSRGTTSSGAATLPNTHPGDNLRLRMKVWTDPGTLKRYLMPMGLFRDVVGGQPVTDVMYAYAMRDEDTKLVILTAAEWNALPFFYFREDGWAPRATSRPVDAIK